MGFSRRLQFATEGITVQPPSATWQWQGSALDSTGGNMNTVYDGTTWYTGVDIAGVARLTSLSAGTVVQWQQGRGVKSGVLDVQSGKCAAMTSNGTKAWSLAGVAPGGGGIHSRDIAGGGIWQLETAAYCGDVSGSVGVGRPTGHRRIYHDTATNAVYVCCQRISDYNGGIARKVGTGSFSDFDAGNGFTIGRMYRAVVGSSVGYADTMYACANSATGDGSTTGNKPCVAVYTGASTASPVFLRLDTIGTGNPGGLLDAQDMICINENGADALYVLVGEGDATNGGLWRCTINGDPTSAGWQTTPTLTWKKLNNGVLAAGHMYRALTGQRVGTATYIMVGNNPAGGGTAPSLTGSIPNQTTKFVAAIYRTLNAHSDTPTWEAITDQANIAPAGSYYPTFGTANETWVQLTGAQSATSNKCVLGGSSWNAYDMDVDTANQTIVVAGKSGSWITQNPWTTTAASVKWQQFSNSTGGVINTAIYIHPTDNTKWTMTDVDRSGYYSLNGGLGQMHGIESAIGSRCHANYIRQGGTSAGRWLLGDDNGIIHVSDNWTTTTNVNTVPTFANDTVTGATALCAVTEFTYNSVDYRLAIDGSGGLYVKAGAGAWSKPYSFGAIYGDTSTFIVNDGFKDFWVMEPKTGLTYFPDVTSISAGTTVSVFPVTVQSSESGNCGRVAQDASNRTTLYVTWGKALTGLWKITGADAITINASGTKLTGTGSVARMSGGPLATTTACGPISVDPTDNSIVALVPGYSGTPDALLFNGTTWTSIADGVFKEVSMIPVWATKRGNRIYTSQSSAGVPFAVYQ